MARQKLFLICCILVMSFAITAVTVTAQDEPIRITYIVNAVLGDKSFFDSGQEGLDRLMDDYDIEVNTIELGVDPANWESGLDDAMSDTDNYDIMIVGTYQMIDFISARADNYPDKVFISFDAAAHYDNPEICTDGCKNLYSITYKQNEGSFLAGAYAGAITTATDLPGINEEVIVGTLGASDIPVINDFIIGYQQGACAVNPDTTVLLQYAGGWNDPARGKEIALAMYEQNADIIFQVAGGTGVGVFEAAVEQQRYAIGVDSDQAIIVQDTNPEQADRILTSMMKNVGNSLYRALELYMDGELPVGEAEALGIAEGGVGLAYNDIYFENTPEEVQTIIAAVEEAVVNGDISVVSAFATVAEDGSEVEGYSTSATCADFPTNDFDLAAAVAALSEE